MCEEYLMNVIMVDVDGVLNNSETKDRIDGWRGMDPERIGLLKTLSDATDSKIVISSTWRLGKEKNDDFWKYLVKKFKEAGLEVYDCTPDLKWSRRCDEILEWLKGENGIEHIVILDDENFWWNRHGLEKYWIDTSAFSDRFRNRSDGLTEEHIKYILDNYDNYYWKTYENTESAGN